jgi:hypothetical protein
VSDKRLDILAFHKQGEEKGDDDDDVYLGYYWFEFGFSNGSYSSTVSVGQVDYRLLHFWLFIEHRWATR